MSVKKKINPLAKTPAPDDDEATIQIVLRPQGWLWDALAAEAEEAGFRSAQKLILAILKERHKARQK